MGKLLIYLFALSLLGLLFRPIRQHMLRRLDLTVTVLLAVVPLMAAVRFLYILRTGGRDDLALVVLIVSALAGVWVGLWWLTSALERRYPTQALPSPFHPIRLVQRRLGLPAVSGAEAESIGLGLARLGGQWFGRVRRTSQSSAEDAPAARPAGQTSSQQQPAPQPQAEQQPSAKPQAEQQPTQRAVPRQQPAKPSQVEGAAVALGRLGGQLFERVRQATRQQVQQVPTQRHPQQSTPSRGPPQQPARGSPSQLESTAVVLGRLGGRLFGRARQASRRK